MTKQQRPNKMPIIIRVVLGIIYLGAFANLAISLMYLLLSGEAIANWFESTPPENKWIVGIAYAIIGIMSAISGWLIQSKRKHAIPFTIIMLLPLTYGLMSFAEQYDSFYYEPYEYILYSLLDALLFGYLMLSNQVKSFLESQQK